MDTSVKVSVDLSLNSTCFGFYSRTNIDALTSDMGGSTQIASSTELNIYPRFNNQAYFRVNSSNVGFAATSNSSLGYFIANRISSTETRNLINSILIIQSANSITSNPSNIYLSAVDALGSLRYSTRQIAFAHISDGLTDTEAANLYTSVQTFQTTLGRQV